MVHTALDLGCVAYCEAAAGQERSCPCLLRKALAVTEIPHTLPWQVTAETQEVADFHMELLLNEAYGAAKAMLERNRGALDVLVEALLANSIISGEEVRAVLEQHGAEEDLRRRREEAAPFL